MADTQALEGTPQAACTAVAGGRQVALATSAPVDAGPTPAECNLARQKALFVSKTQQVASERRISLQLAATLAAADPHAFPALLSGGKGGRSLLADSSAYHNYRSWAGQLARAAARGQGEDAWRTLLPAYRGSRQYSRPGHDSFWATLANLYEHPNRLSLKTAYLYAVTAIRNTGVTVPTYSQVKHWYNVHADLKAIHIARNGEESFRNMVAGYISRQAPEVDAVWFGDHHLFDVGVRVVDPDTGNWRAARPWLTAWMDWGSLFFIGYVIRAASGNRDSIERALRAGVWAADGHAPAHLYIDNGKDFSAAGFARPMLSSSDKTALSSVAQGLGSKVIFAIPYNARAKVIERQFRVVCEQFSKLWPSYRGSNPQDRPANAHEVWRDVDNLPSLEDFSATFARWLALSYHDVPSEGRILEGKSPASARASLPRCAHRLSQDAIYKAFLRELPRDRVIERGGVVRALRRDYRSEALWRLFQPGRDVRVRVKVDPDDINVAWVYDLQGREIGAASAKPLLPGIIDHSDPASVEQLRAEQHRHARQIQEAKAASVANRDLSRWLNRPAAPISSTSGLLPPQSFSSAPKRAIAQRSDCPPVTTGANRMDHDPSLHSELDAALREQSSASLFRPDATAIDDADMEIIDALEADRADSINRFALPQV